MKKNKIYYLLLGIGLGIIITSSLNIVFTKEKKVEYTDEEIKEKAKGLGMISIKENIEKNDKEKNEKKKDSSENTQADKDKQPDVETNQQSDENTELKTNSKSNQITEKQTESQTQVKAQTGHKLIVIDISDTASTIIHKLKSNGIIESEKELKELVVKHNLQTKFRVGTYEIKENSTYEEVLKKLIKENELKNAGFL